LEPLYTVESADDVGRQASPIVGSPSMERLYLMATRVAPSPVSVMIVGERGVGKTTLAQWLHGHSERARGPRVTLPCTTMDHDIEKAMFGCVRNVNRDAHPGAFESASGGTVVLEDLEALNLGAQAKLLRVIESREVTRVGGIGKLSVDIRLISTTSADLEEAISVRTLRSDLFFRLNAISLEIPPLRKRREEIEPLAARFLAEARAGDQTPRLSVEVLDLFRSFAWPRNLAQLREVVTNALARCAGPEITPEHIDVEALRSETPPPITFDPDERREQILKTLAAVNGRATGAAETAGLSRRALIEKLRAYSIRRPPPDDE
jgi:DNA-binding NtrC family response regulator